MNTVWSDHIQGVLTLYLSRKLRFDDAFRERYEAAFQLPGGAKKRVLEIGCGPGATAGALHRWHPDWEITALDRDRRFITFAREHEPGIEFVEGDATCLPFADESFDVTISYTVQEHVAPGAFWGEQRRVLRSGGVCLCLSVRKGIEIRADCLRPTPEEERFWAGLASDDTLEKYGVGRYRCSEAELPRQMEQHGFRNVSTGYALIDLTPDDPRYPAAFAQRMIEAERQSDIEAILSAPADGREEVLRAVNEQYDARQRLYDDGQKQWDTAVTLTLIVRGEKE